jgi:hypothetical protein
MWLRRGINGGRLLWTRQWTIQFYKRQRISWLAAWLLDSQEGLYSTQSVRSRHFFLFRKRYIWFPRAFEVRTDSSVPCKIKGWWLRTVGTNSIIWEWFRLECAKFPGTTDYTAKLVINPVYQQAKYRAVTRFWSNMRDFPRAWTIGAHSAPTGNKNSYEIPQQMKTTIEVEPQNSDIYVNSEVHCFTVQRGINNEAVIRIV